MNYPAPDSQLRPDSARHHPRESTANRPLQLAPGQRDEAEEQGGRPQTAPTTMTTSRLQPLSSAAPMGWALPVVLFGAYPFYCIRIFVTQSFAGDAPRPSFTSPFLASTTHPSSSLPHSTPLLVLYLGSLPAPSLPLLLLFLRSGSLANISRPQKTDIQIAPTSTRARRRIGVEALDEVSKVLLYPKLERGEGGAFLRYGLRVGFTSSDGALPGRRERSRMRDPSTFLSRPTLRSDAFAQSRREEGVRRGMGRWTATATGSSLGALARPSSRRGLDRALPPSRILPLLSAFCVKERFSPRPLLPIYSPYP